MKTLTAILAAAALAIGSAAYAEDHPVRVDQHQDAVHGAHTSGPDIHVNTDHNSDHSTVGAHVDNHGAGADTHAVAPHDQGGRHDNPAPRDH